jgi:hypothetical protein
LVLSLDCSQNSSVTRSRVPVRCRSAPPARKCHTADAINHCQQRPLCISGSYRNEPVFFARRPSLGSRRRWRDEGRSEPSPAVPRLTRRTSGQCQRQRQRYQAELFFFLGLSPFSILPKCGHMQGGCRDANTLGLKGGLQGGATGNDGKGFLERASSPPRRRQTEVPRWLDAVLSRP